MVARETPPSPSYARPSDPLSLLQRLLATVARGMSALGRGVWKWLAALGRTMRRLIAGEELGTQTGRRVALVLGPTAVALGALLSVALSPAAEGPLELATALLVALAWSGARLVVMRVAAGPLGRDEAPAITAAWAAGLIPYAAAVSPVLRVASWAVSLLLTRVYVDRTTENKLDGSRIMLWVAGFEAAAALGLWITNAIAPILAL